MVSFTNVSWKMVSFFLKKVAIPSHFLSILVFEIRSVQFLPQINVKTDHYR